MKQIMTPTVLWQGDRIQCMKTSRTLQCKICMMERKEILHRFRTDRYKIINDNSDIFSSCKCGSAFHKFFRTITTKTTLRTRSPQKKVTSTRQSKPTRRRFSFFNILRQTPSPTTNEQCQPCSTSTVGSTSTSSTDEPASPPVAPVFLFDPNSPGFPTRSPSCYPTNLERAQARYLLDRLPILEV